LLQGTLAAKVAARERADKGKPTGSFNSLLDGRLEETR